MGDSQRWDPYAYEFNLLTQLNEAVEGCSVYLVKPHHIPGGNFGITLVPRKDIDGFTLSIVYRGLSGWSNLPKVILEEAESSNMFTQERLKVSSTREHELYAVFAHVPRGVPLRLSFSRSI